MGREVMEESSVIDEAKRGTVDAIAIIRIFQ
jgi:hypothetical protein